MSGTPVGRRVVPRPARKVPSRTTPVAVPSSYFVAPREGSAEIAALVDLAQRDGALRGEDERRRLGALLSREVLEAYELALRAGRQPAVVRLVASVCSGCHVRLPTTLDQKIRRVRGVGACPHCLRLVYDPEWLVAGREEGRAGR